MNRSCKFTAFGRPCINNNLHSSPGKSIPSYLLARMADALGDFLNSCFVFSISVARKILIESSKVLDILKKHF